MNKRLENLGIVGAKLSVDPEGKRFKHAYLDLRYASFGSAKTLVTLEFQAHRLDTDDGISRAADAPAYRLDHGCHPYSCYYAPRINLNNDGGTVNQELARAEKAIKALKLVEEQAQKLGARTCDLERVLEALEALKCPIIMSFGVDESAPQGVGRAYSAGAETPTEESDFQCLQGGPYEVRRAMLYAARAKQALQGNDRATWALESRIRVLEGVQEPLRGEDEENIFDEMFQKALKPVIKAEP